MVEAIQNDSTILRTSNHIGLYTRCQSPVPMRHGTVSRMLSQELFHANKAVSTHALARGSPMGAGAVDDPNPNPDVSGLDLNPNPNPGVLV